MPRPKPPVWHYRCPGCGREATHTGWERPHEFWCYMPTEDGERCGTLMRLVEEKEATDAHD